MSRFTKHIRTAIDNRRKHYTQMSAAEVEAIKRKITSTNFAIRSHAIDRMNEKGVTELDVQFALAGDFAVIEANNNRHKDLRILIRGQKTAQGKELCVVVSATYNEVVTVYWSARHQYNTIDRSLYQWHEDISDALRNRSLLFHTEEMLQKTEAFRRQKNENK